MPDEFDRVEDPTATIMTSRADLITSYFSKMNASKRTELLSVLYPGLAMGFISSAIQNDAWLTVLRSAGMMSLAALSSLTYATILENAGNSPERDDCRGYFKNIASVEVATATVTGLLSVLSKNGLPTSLPPGLNDALPVRLATEGENLSPIDGEDLV